MSLKADTLPQSEMYSKLLEGFVLLSRFFLTFCFIKFNLSSIQLVRSYRYNNKIKHQILLNLGRLDQIKDNSGFQHIAIRLQEISNLKNQINMDDISKAKIVNWAYIVYQKLWQEFGLDKILNRLTKKRKTLFNLDDTSFLIVI